MSHLGIRESVTGPIHPGALPSGPRASKTAWELAGVSTRQPSWSMFGWFQHPAGSRMCTSHLMEHIWLVIESNWLQVYVIPVLPPKKPSILILNISYLNILCITPVNMPLSQKNNNIHIKCYCYPYTSRRLQQY